MSPPASGLPVRHCATPNTSGRHPLALALKVEAACLASHTEALGDGSHCPALPSQRAGLRPLRLCQPACSSWRLVSTVARPASLDSRRSTRPRYEVSTAATQQHRGFVVRGSPGSATATWTSSSSGSTASLWAWPASLTTRLSGWCGRSRASMPPTSRRSSHPRSSGTASTHPSSRGEPSCLARRRLRPRIVKNRLLNTLDILALGSALTVKSH